MRRSVFAMILGLGLGAGMWVHAQDAPSGTSPRSSLGERFTRLRSNLNNAPTGPAAGTAPADAAPRVQYPSTSGSAPSADPTFGYPSTGGPAAAPAATSAPASSAAPAAGGSAVAPSTRALFPNTTTSAPSSGAAGSAPAASPRTPDDDGARLPFMPKERDAAAGPAASLNTKASARSATSAEASAFDTPASTSAAPAAGRPAATGSAFSNTGYPSTRSTNAGPTGGYPSTQPSSAPAAPVRSRPAFGDEGDSAPAAAPSYSAPSYNSAPAPAPASAPARNTYEGGSSYRGAPAPAAPADPASQGVLFSKQFPVLTFETLGSKRTVIQKESTYRVVVRNSGGAPARDVVMQLKVPEWVEIVHAEAGQTGFVSRSQEKPDHLQWTLKRLEPQASEELTLRIVPRKGLPFELSLTASQAPVAGQANVEVSEPKLLMAISGPQEVNYNKPEIFRLVVSNPGTADAENVELKLMASNPGEQAPPPHPLGLIPAGEKKVVELELTARQGGTLKIDAQVTGFGGVKAEAREAVLIRKPEVKVALKGPKFRYTGSAANYDLVVANPGNATAQNIQLVMLVPPGAKFVAASHRGVYDAERARITWRLSSIDPGVEQGVNCRIELNEPGQTRLQAAATADDDVKDSTATVTQIEAIADLVMSVNDPRGPVPCGEEVLYEVKVTNRGTQRADKLRVTASLSAGLKVLPPPEGTMYRVSPGLVTFDAAESLAPGQSLAFKVRATAVSGGNHLFRAELKCDSLETSMIKEEITRFYADDQDAASDATGPAPAGAEPKRTESEEAAKRPEAPAGPIRWTR